MQLIKNEILGCEMEYIKKGDEIWFRGKQIAQILGYKDTDQAIRKNIEKEDKSKLKNIRPVEETGLTYNMKNSLMINESGLYSLILSSKLPKAKKFKHWVTTEVLPTIRKTGSYNVIPSIKNINRFKIENEFDLQCKVVNFIRTKYPKLIMSSTSGIKTDTRDQRLTTWKMGYTSGTPDLMIYTQGYGHSGFAIEIKTPSGYGKVSDKQTDFLAQLENNNWKTLISNNYDEIILQVHEYVSDIKYEKRLRCNQCTKTFKNDATLDIHKHIYHFENYYK